MAGAEAVYLRLFSAPLKSEQPDQRQYRLHSSLYFYLQVEVLTSMEQHVDMSPLEEGNTSASSISASSELHLEQPKNAV